MTSPHMFMRAGAALALTVLVAGCGQNPPAGYQG